MSGALAGPQQSNPGMAEMTSESILHDIPGGKALLEWFGRVPHFHDAEVLDIVLASQRPSILRIHTWNMTNEVDAQGYFILEKHAVVVITLEEATQVTLYNFDLPGIIGFLEITKNEAGYLFDWDASYGVAGTLQARRASFDLVPGKPQPARASAG